MRGDGVERPAVGVEQLDPQAVERRRVRRPEPRVGDPQLYRRLPLSARHLAPVERGRHPYRGGRAARHRRRHPQRPVAPRFDGQPLDERVRHPLQPHALPDARHPRVEDLLGVELLLALELEAAGLVPHLDPDGVLADPHRVRGVERERQVPAAVAPEQAPVDPHPAIVVDGAEVQPEPSGGRLLQLEAPLAPQRFVGFERPADARELRLDRERHADLTVPATGFLATRRRHRVAPRPVQCLPALPLQVRPRVLRPGNRVGIGEQRVAPGRGQIVHPRSLPARRGPCGFRAGFADGPRIQASASTDDA